MRKYVVLLIVLSVAMNLGFAGVWATRTVAGHWPAGHACSHDNCRGVVWCPLHRQLGVTDEQWQRLEPRLAQFRQAAQAVCQETQRKRAELIDLVAAGTDRTQITAKQEEILAGQRRMQGLVIEELLAEKEVLTVEQQKALFDMIRWQSGCRGPALMRGGPGESSPSFSQDGPGDAK
jgi:Spy/CpxP family protein refolding chaperone